MKLALSAEMKKIDDHATHRYGIPGIVIMENAGKVVVDEVMKMGERYQHILVVCGTGNNGGNGFVIARHLLNLYKNMTVIVVGNAKNIEGDSLQNLDILRKLDAEIEYITDADQLPLVEKLVRVNDMVIDALIGIGIHGDVAPLHESIINCINEYSKYTLSVDIPSGVNGSTGEVMNVAIQADKTVSLVLPKVGNILYPGADYNGELIIKGIGIPDKIIEEIHLKYKILSEDEVVGKIPKRRPNTHKGDYGKANVIAGSQGLTGAAILTSRAALRTGLGLLKLYIPESLNILITTSVPEVVTIPLQEMRKGTIGLNHINRIIEDTEHATVLAIGPGCGNTTELAETIRRILLEVDKPIVIDADGLNALSRNVSWLNNKKAPVVITPHPGEMARLTGMTTAEINRRPIEVARDFATKWDVVVVLKGSRTIIALPSGEVYVNINGNPGMATAGTGDILTGMITGFIAQGLSPVDAVLVGVYLHGLAGDLMAEMKGERGLLAGDIIEGMTYAFKQLARTERFSHLIDKVKESDNE